MVETKDVDLPDTMKRAMARQVERERRGVISREHGAPTLRTLQTLVEVATEHNSTLVLPIPMDLLESVRGVDLAPHADGA